MRSLFFGDVAHKALHKMRLHHSFLCSLVHLRGLPFIPLNDYFHAMNTFLFCLAVLLAASLARGAVNEASQVLDADLRSWNQLKRDAGYFTESGLWRGGLYRKARSTETGLYHCLSHTGVHCIQWRVLEHGHEDKTGTCHCEETDSPFCHRWQCDKTYNYECGVSKHPRTCVAEESSTCTCMMLAVNERYCWKWQCREGSTVRGGFQDKLYECIDADLTDAFCLRWHGNISSKYQAESAACECSERVQSFCKSWQCIERGMARCEQSGLGWCRQGIAVGVGGGMGLLLFLIGLLLWQMRLAVAKAVTLKLEVKHVLTCFVLLCLPWTTGVLIWGGIVGFLGVFLVWAMAFFAVIYAIKRAECKCKKEGAELGNKESVELPTSDALRIQLPVVVFATMSSTDEVRKENAR